MSLHAFVAMPFGVKEDIDFNAVYYELIKPALREQGFDVFRADEESRAGGIVPDMFQELLFADLVVADLSIDNPNVWYELGIRHALRKRAVIPIQCKRDYMPFDVYAERTLRYKVTADSPAVPDPKTLRAQREVLGRFARDTMESWRGMAVSPVYDQLRELKEPDWSDLRTHLAGQFKEQFDDWQQRIRLARKRGRAGDIVILADEAPGRMVRLDALNVAAKALRALGSYRLAADQIDKALSLDDRDLVARQEKGMLLGRLGRADAAQVWMERVVRDHPQDPESQSLLGRVVKDAWVESWRRDDIPTEQRKREAQYETARLRIAIEAYRRAFEMDPSHYYSGINALTLWNLRRFLDDDDSEDPILMRMRGAVGWAASCAVDRDGFWAQVTLADLALTVADERTVERAYRDAVAKADREWFALDSSRQQLLLLQELGFRPDAVAAGLRVLERELERARKPWQPDKVFLFSGHMIDAPDRQLPRFPADKEQSAAAHIAAKLDELNASETDLALCGGACGGDLLFAEACLERGLHLEMHLPFDIPEFLKESVRFPQNGELWQQRFETVRQHQHASFRVCPKELGPPPGDSNPYVRNNLWMLYTALGRGGDKTRFIALWNGAGGDGAGGTQHMMASAENLAAQVFHLDTTKLW